MIVNVMVVTEISYTIDIPDIPEEEEDKLYEDLSCLPRAEDITDVEYVLEEKDVYYETFEERTDSRIETWR